MSSPTAMATTPSKGKKTPRTPRSRQFKFSTTGTEVAHIETIESDPSLRTFPEVLVSQIKHYLHTNANKGNEIELTFARNGNTKLSVNGEGFPAYFVVPETDQKLDAGRYRYGLMKQSPLIVVVQQKEDSSVKFNNGQPAIVLYHGKHSSIDGPNKVSKWAVWSTDGLRPDIIVWRIAEGARMVKTTQDANESTLPKPEDDEDLASNVGSPHQVYGNSQSIFQEPFPKRLRFDQQRLAPSSPSPWNQLNVHYPPTPDGVSPQNNCLKVDLSTNIGTGRIPIDPQLLSKQASSESYTPSAYTSVTGALSSSHLSYSAGCFPNLYSIPNQSLPHTPIQNDSFNFFNCGCRGLFVERRNAEMAAATDRVLNSGYTCTVNFNFRTSITCETQVTKTLGDCRSLSQVFAYGRLYRTILLDHNVISVHFLNGSFNQSPCYMVMDDVEQWRTLMGIIEQEVFVMEKEARDQGRNMSTLDLVVLDEGY